MSSATSSRWQAEFGLDERTPPGRFATPENLDAEGEAFSQAHVLRRAFDALGLDGAICTDNAPLVYFKQTARLDAEYVSGLHRRFWNHGGAPLLVLISPTEVHIYSGLSRPVSQDAAHGSYPHLVDRLTRSSTALRKFLSSVESGEFLRRHAKSFNPEHRVDRALLDNLQATRDQLSAAGRRALEPRVLDALLCRLVFTCYLFDRGVIGTNYLASLGIPDAAHLRDILALRPRRNALQALYALFRQLGQDFNGDLFSDDLSAEEAAVRDEHVAAINEFFRGSDVRRGQQSLWPYDFSVIPIETISAIYERFLRPADRKAGSFYTPRFLAEVILDLALSGQPSLLNRTYLDPACGSGIFLVGLFNRIAQEWQRANPTARNDRRARELMALLRSSLFGVDTNPTACRITAFSLYLAYLDQLSPRDIQTLQQRGRALPRLVANATNIGNHARLGNIWCGDFFDENAEYPNNVNLVIGNPPWGSVAVEGTPAATWCSMHSRPIADKQVATAFAWKAADHAAPDARICLLLPVGTLFNLTGKALEVQRAFLQRHTVETVLNLADYQRFLFEEAGHPALAINYRPTAPSSDLHEITYWAPKADWLVTRAEVITVSPDDQSQVRLREVLADLDTADAPQIWKRRYWATGRDWRLLDRLSSYPRLRDHVRRPREDASNKPWIMAVGFQPVNEADDPDKAKTITLPSNAFIRARSPELDLFLISTDCAQLPQAAVQVRSGSNTNTAVFSAPHVLVSKGFTSTAFADFSCSFQDAVRGISGPAGDTDLLAFLAAYLRTPLAKYFLFHTSSNWGVSRQQAYVEEMLRLPFPTPDVLPNPDRAWHIVRRVAKIVAEAAASADTNNLFLRRKEIVQTASSAIEPLVDEYFDLLPVEKALVNDTVEIVVPSVRPTRNRVSVPTITPSTQAQRAAYVKQLCGTLNQWAKSSGHQVRGWVRASVDVGLGLAVLEKSRMGSTALPLHPEDIDLLQALDEVRRSVSRRLNTLEIVKGVKVFEGDRLYIVKPLGQRHWTPTAALNDADEIAGTILMRTPAGVA